MAWRSGMKNELKYLSETEKRAVNSFVKQLQENLGDHILDIRLFGSKVRGDFRSDSDIDIFILVKKRSPDIEDKVSEIEVNHDIEYGLPLSTVLYSLFEYHRNKELGSFFFENVEKEGVVLYDKDKSR
jgi:predicted nucleotidyltransferase